MPSRACSRKLVSSTSAPSSSFIMASCPPSVRRFKETKRLFRFCMSKLGLASGVQGERVVPACLRQASPLSVSTLITSAPHSARTRAHMGPASMVDSSTTLIPSNGFILIKSSFYFVPILLQPPAGVGIQGGNLDLGTQIRMENLFFPALIAL